MTTESPIGDLADWINSNSDKFSGVTTQNELESRLLDIGLHANSVSAVSTYLPEIVDNIMREDLARAEFERDSIEQVQIERVESAVRDIEQLPQKESFVSRSADALRSVGNSIKSILGKLFRR